MIRKTVLSLVLLNVCLSMSKDPEIIGNDPVINEMVQSTVGGMPTAEVRFPPEGWMLSKSYIPHVEKIKNFKVRPDDVWILSFPKCGTTWSQEMLWVLMNNCDVDKANSQVLYERSPFLELKAISAPDSPVPDMMEVAERLKSPRVIKSHLPPELLPTGIWTVKPKLVYVYRNPKDAAISYYNHYRLWNEYTGSQDLFTEAFLQDKVMFSPFWKHVLAFWNRQKELSNLKFITFENMKKDLKTVLREVAAHLEVKIPDGKEEAVLDHLSFASMSNNPMLNFEAERKEMGKLDQHFFRKGDTGEWKMVLTPEQVKRFDAWSSKFLNGSDFPYYA